MTRIIDPDKDELKDYLAPGMVVQIDPGHDEMFGGCMMIVDEVRAWGAQGYVKVPGKGDAFYRCPWGAMEIVSGWATWLRADDESEGVPESGEEPGVKAGGLPASEGSEMPPQ